MTGINWADTPQEWFSTYNPNEDGQTVEEQRRDPSYFAMTPKMAQLELDPYELALYVNYKQTCGDKRNQTGKSWKSNKTLAKETHMSIGKVKQARRSLAQKGYIRIEYPVAPGKALHDSARVTIVDVWEINHAYCVALEGGHDMSTPGHTVTTPGHHMSTNNNHRIRTKKKKDSVPSTDEQSSADALDQTITPDDTTTPKIERPRDLMWDIIAKEWTLPPVRIGKMKKFLLGGFVKTGDKKHDSKYAAEIDNNIDYPMSHEELAGFVKWYRQRNPTISLPESPEALSTWVYRYREHAKAKTAAPTQSPMIDMRELIGGGS